MANWFINTLTVGGDISSIKKMVETHFRATSNIGNLDKPSYVVTFNDKDEDEDCSSVGFDLIMGSLPDYLGGESGKVYYPWNGNYCSPFWIQWRSRWVPADVGVRNAARDFPGLTMDYAASVAGCPEQFLIKVRPGVPVIDNGNTLFYELGNWLERRIKHEMEAIRFAESRAESYRSDIEPSAESLRLGVESLKAWNIMTDGMTRFIYEFDQNDEGQEVTQWLEVNCPNAPTFHDDASWDRSGDNLYIALDPHDAVVFEAHWKDRIWLQD